MLLSAMCCLRKCTPASSLDKKIIFVGSERSDVHLLASGALAPSNYCRVDVGDVSGLVKVLYDIESAVVDERKRQLASERMAVS